MDKNLLGSVSKQIRRGLAFSKDAQAELTGATDRLIGNIRAAAALFMTRDPRAARMLAGEKETFRDLEARATQRHFEHLRSGARERFEVNALTLEILRDLKRVNAHLVAASAYPVLESNGELLSSRVRQGDSAGDDLG